MLNEEFLSIAQVAKMFNKSKVFFTKKCADKEITAYKVGKKAWVIKPTDLQEWLDKVKNTNS